ncbi:lipopolysaccharide biosynthesis protein [Mesorhizobium sp. BAC0120]|uniref:lipopolysaccharide biosynthesis protein n=1 Tax=Mesorhizobium sp. BAC0120 TaxID=3090670 RepID=UPI00298C6816|nr:lipopolysaccharide biosynthesis protein [Mesorhizobium sp. BAC0120]MDW6025921.1 lipopolysaccharide biosynthesis protein [Mesorhizobium sp. BAC0120]
MSAEPGIFDPPRGSLRKSVGRGVVATALAQSVKLAAQVASVVVLSRLLAPEDFGVVAMCAPVLAFVALFQDFGLTQATVQKSEVTQQEVNYLFWINVGISIGLAGLLAAASPLVALFYGDPKVGPLTAAMGLQIIVYGLGAQHFALLTRRMEFGRVATIEVAGALTVFLVSIAWTMMDRSYWALYAGALTGAVLTTSCAWASSLWRPGPPRRVAGGSGLVRFGAGVTGFNFANFFSRNLDNVLIGKFWGGAQLGLYDRAYKLLIFPLNQTANPLAKVMIPALARLQHEPDRYRRAYLQVIQLLLLAVLPGVAFATAMADVLVPFVLGPKWQGSSEIFAALGFAGLLQPLNNPGGWLFISQGRSGDFMRWGIVAAITSVLAFIIGLPYGAWGVAVGYAASEYFRTPILWVYVGRKGPLRVADIVRAASPFVLGSHLALALVLLAKDSLLAHQPVAALLAAAIASYMVVVAVALLFPAGRETLREGLQLFRTGFFH